MLCLKISNAWHFSSEQQQRRRHLVLTQTATTTTLITPTRTIFRVRYFCCSCCCLSSNCHCYCCWFMLVLYAIFIFIFIYMFLRWLNYEYKCTLVCHPKRVPARDFEWAEVGFSLKRRPKQPSGISQPIIQPLLLRSLTVLDRQSINLNVVFGKPI